MHKSRMRPFLYLPDCGWYNGLVIIGLGDEL